MKKGEFGLWEIIVTVIAIFTMGIIAWILINFIQNVLQK